MRRMYSKPQLLEAIQEESKINGIKVFEDIKDNAGHKRFYEEDFNIEEITGVSKAYCKWSLSGSHLLIVMAINIADTTALTDNQVLATLTFPEWIYNKLVGVVQNTLAYSAVPAYASNYTSQNFGARIQKSGSNKLQILKNTNLTLTADRGVRVAFDFLIDNE